MRKQKKVFLYIIIGFSLIILLLPFLVSFNEALTGVFERNLFYVWIQKSIVPIEAKMLGVILMTFRYSFGFSPEGSSIIVNNIVLEITWNCLGWQSFLLLFFTFFAGFKGKYSQNSILEALLLGILGTFWLNILRVLFIVLLAVHAPPIFRIVFHDYLAAFTTIIWLFFYWWFCYSFILEEKKIKVLN